MTDARIVLTTLNDREKADQIAATLIESRVAACVNMVDRVRSMYRWQGRVESSEEILLLIKTSADALPDLKTTLQKIHPYQVPELLVLPIVDAGEPYLAWLLGSIREPLSSSDPR